MGMFDDFATGTWSANPNASVQPAPVQPLVQPPVVIPPQAAPRPAPAPSSAADPGESWSPNDPVPPPRLRPAPGSVPFTPLGELKPADLSYSDTARSKAQDALMAVGIDKDKARHLGHGVVNIANALTPMGSVLGAADLTYNLPRGNLVASGFDALSMVPLVGSAVRRMRGAATPMARTAEQTTVDQLDRSARDAYRFSERSPLEYHPDAMGDVIGRTRAYLQSPYHGSGSFSPEKAAEVYTTLQRFEQAFPRGGNRPVTATDFDTLRQQLKGLPGPNGPAGRDAINVLDTYMLRPPNGMLTRGTPQDIAELHNSFLQARGDYRAARTSETVADAIQNAQLKAATEHSGMNEGNRIRQGLRSFITSDAGRNRLLGATPEELAAIERAAVGDATTNRLRAGSNFFAGGGGWGSSNLAVTGAAGTGALAHMMGMDPVTSMGAAAIGGGVPIVAGRMMRNAANERTARAGTEVAEEIARNSPLYRQREAASPPVVDPYWRRNVIAKAVAARSMREPGTDLGANLYVPYENRE